MPRNSIAFEHTGIGASADLIAKLFPGARRPYIRKLL